MISKIHNLLGIYYPEDLLKNRHELTVACLLFDQVMLYGITGGMACGGCSGLVEDLWRSELDAGELIDSEILLIVEEDQDGLTGEEYFENDFEKYHQIQITMNVLEKCNLHKGIPFTMKNSLNLPLEIINPNIFQNDALTQSIPISRAALNLALPDFAELSNQDILEARDKLKEHLIPFRAEMVKLSPLVRSMYNSEVAFKDIHLEAEYIVDTNILPILIQMNDRIKREKQGFWRKLLKKTPSSFSKIVLSYLNKGLIQSAIESVPEISRLAFLNLDSENSIEHMISASGLGLLLSVSEFTSESE